MTVASARAGDRSTRRSRPRRRDSPRCGRATTTSSLRHGSPSAARVVRSQPRPGQKRLDAAALAAVARRPGPLVVVRPRQRVVAPLARDRVRRRSTRRPSTTTPPPVPVPRITPKTTRAPAAAPSTASDTARQFASLASRTSRCRRRSRSCLERPAVQPRRVGVLDESGRRRNRAGHADADRARRAGRRSPASTSPAMASIVAS